MALLVEPKVIVRRLTPTCQSALSAASVRAMNARCYEITVELPGVSEDEITVEVHDGRLTVAGEKRAAREEKGKDYYFSERVYGSFRRAFRLPADADEDNILAEHRDGVLTIRVAKLAPNAPEPRKIKVAKH